MRKVLLFLALFPTFAYGQITDGFEGAFFTGWTESTSGRWGTDTTRALAGNYSLRHLFDNSTEGTDCIGKELTNHRPAEGTTTWKLKVRHGYNPSSSNNWGVWLMCSAPPSALATNSDLSGFILGVNFSGSDDTLKLWRVDRGAKSVVAKCPLNWEKDVGVSTIANISVDRSPAGEWWVEVGIGEKIFTSNGLAEQLYGQSWFVIRYKYSMNFDRLLWIDDINVEGVFYADTLAPTVEKIVVTGKRSLQITFSEEILPESLPLDGIGILGTDNGTDNGANNGANNGADSLKWVSPRELELFFQKNFANRQLNSMVIGQPTDIAGNRAEPKNYEFFPVWAVAGDVVISEIMADPLPRVSLPEAEYIELHNLGQYSFSLYNWSISTTGQSAQLPNDSLKSGEYAILCAMADTALFKGYGKTIGVKSFPRLTDSGALLWISDGEGALVHGVEYSQGWYRSDLKGTGGWSLEIIDPRYPFYWDGNWGVSASATGGTPGRENSILRENPDRFFKGITNVFATSGRTIRIDFSEPVFGLEEVGKLKNGNKNLRNIVAPDILGRSFSAEMPGEMGIGVVYSVNIGQRVLDFAGNSGDVTEFSFALTAPAGSGDIVFNELLFNPLSGDPDYIEFYNRGENPIDLSLLWLASVDTESGDTSSVTPLFPYQRCLLPGDFLVTTTDGGAVSRRYGQGDSSRIFTVPALPSMPDDRGHLLLLTRQLEAIDGVIYTEKMHYQLLTGVEGISLEKLRPDLPSMDSQSWHSAAESSGFGTPGRANSVYLGETPASGEEISFSTTRITADNDGRDDILEIRFGFTTVGNVVSVTIYTEEGRLARRLAENVTVEGGSSMLWDGTRGDGSLAASGIYIVLVECFNANGARESVKSVCSVIR